MCCWSKYSPGYSESPWQERSFCIGAEWVSLYLKGSRYPSSVEHIYRFSWPLYTLPNVEPRKSQVHLLLLVCGERGQGVNYCWELQKCSSAVSTEATVGEPQWESRRWSPRAASGLACSQLLQASLWEGRQAAELTGKLHPPAFRESLSSAFRLHSHAILSVSSFVCPLFTRWHLTAHHNHHREPPPEACEFT